MFNDLNNPLVGPMRFELWPQISKIWGRRPQHTLCTTEWPLYICTIQQHHITNAKYNKTYLVHLYEKVGHLEHLDLWISILSDPTLSGGQDFWYQRISFFWQNKEVHIFGLNGFFFYQYKYFQIDLPWK